MHTFKVRNALMPGGKRRPSFKMVSNMVIQLLHSIKYSVEVPFSNMAQQPMEMQKTAVAKKVKKNQSDKQPLPLSLSDWWRFTYTLSSILSQNLQFTSSGDALGRQVRVFNRVFFTFAGITEFFCMSLQMTVTERFKLRRKRQQGSNLQPSNRVNKFLSQAIEARSIDQGKDQPC